jgi:pyruvate dehydrogenase E1 component
MIVSTEERLKLAPADPQPIDVDPSETQEWLESLEAVVRTQGLERAKFLLQALLADAHKHGVRLPYDVTSPYVNTISLAEQPHFPGIREIERRIKSIIRWNAMAMVVRAGKYPGLGGHISTYASAATLYEVGFNHFFKGNAAPGGQTLSTIRVTPPPASTPARFWKADSPKNTSKTSAANCNRTLASPATPTPT